MAMATLKKVWLDKGRFMNELHLLEVIDTKNNRLNEGCQFLHGEGGTELGQNVPPPALAECLPSVGTGAGRQAPGEGALK
jgi:hypothetical protein